MSSPPVPARSSAQTASATFIALMVLAVLAAVCSVMFGVRSIGVADALAALSGATETPAQATAWTRIPRTVMAMCVGAALAAAGTTFQAITRNPLADPGIFGVLAGAALAIAIGLAFGALGGTFPRIVVAIIGSFAAAAFVYSISSLGRGGATPLKLALSGAATAAALSSLTTAIILPRTQVMDEFRYWQIGSVSGATWEVLLVAAPALMVGAAIVLASAPGLNALALGDDTATGLGIQVARTRLIATFGAVVLCGVATAIAGPIAFVGLIVPHFLRLLLGTDHRVLLPASLLAGAVVLTAADTIGRLLTNPAEVSVGIITPLLGGPLFIWMARRTKVGQL